MTTDIMTAAFPTPTDEDCLDLGALFAPLQREEIELMIVKMLNKHPQEAGWIVLAARKPVDTLEINNEVASIINNGISISGVCDDLENYITRSSDYLKSGHVRNSVAVLEVITPAIAQWTSEQGALEDMEADDKSNLEGFFALLENAWQSLIEQCRVIDSAAGTKPTGVASKTTLTRTSGAEKQAKQRAGRLAHTELAKHEMEFHATLLGDAKKKLTPTIGPMFSDPLRSLNKKRAAAAAAPAPAPAAAASSAAAAAGTKRKSAPESDKAETTTEEAAPAAAPAATKKAKKNAP